MEQIIEYLTVDKFNLLQLLLWCAFVFVITLWGCVSAIKDNAKKEKKAKEVLLDEMHRMYLKEPATYADVCGKDKHVTTEVAQHFPTDAEECKNALSYLESLNVETKSSDGKA
ncbi:MAG: hypothetical protein J6C06_08080 [Lachnospiraceae bacterium]|nr:hypothetical protein [Lachnospiraceae bacterium]